MLLALRSSDSRAYSRVVSLNLCVGLATANPLQIFAGLVGLGHGVDSGKIHAWGLLAGAIPVLAGFAVFELASEFVGQGGSLIAAILTTAGTATALGRLQGPSKECVKDELGANLNYVAVQSPPILSREVELVERRLGKFGMEF
jgi:hypothetical protein